MSIVPPDPDSNKSHPPTVTGVARMMLASADPFTREVGSLVHYVGEQHTHPITCDCCREELSDYPCPVQDSATSIVIAWLIKVVEERG